jgi:hypothetical protein
MTRGEAWRKWWHEKHGKNMPMGGYHPMEGNMYDAFTAGWEAHSKLSAVPDQTGHIQNNNSQGKFVPLEM